jgi:hypothetical protein
MNERSKCCRTTTPLTQPSTNTLYFGNRRQRTRPRWAEEGWDGLVADADADAHPDAQVDPEDDGNDATHGNEQDLAEADTTTTVAMAKAASEVEDERTNALKV